MSMQNQTTDAANNRAGENNTGPVTSRDPKGGAMSGTPTNESSTQSSNQRGQQQRGK